MPSTFNNALYFFSNGSKLKTFEWKYDIYNENLRHWGKFGNPDTIYKGIQGVCQSAFYIYKNY